MRRSSLGQPRHVLGSPAPEEAAQLLGGGGRVCGEEGGAAQFCLARGGGAEAMATGCAASRGPAGVGVLGSRPVVSSRPLCSGAGSREPQCAGPLSPGPDPFPAPPWPLEVMHQSCLVCFKYPRPHSYSRSAWGPWETQTLDAAGRGCVLLERLLRETEAEGC